MSLPEFRAESSALEGSVIFLEELIASESKTVILKNFGDSELVQLVTSSEILSEGVVGIGDPGFATSADILGYHYYCFPDDITVYAEQILAVMPV